VSRKNVTLQPIAARDAATAASAALTGARHTNYFHQPFETERVLIAPFTGGLVIAVPEGDVHRVYYIATDPAAVVDALASIDPGTDVVASELHREGRAVASSPLVSAGFQPYRSYQRMQNRTPVPYAIHHQIEFAQSTDAANLYASIHASFDKFTDHLPSLEAVEERIRRREILLQRNAEEICGYVVFVASESEAHFNYIYNACGQGGADALISTFYTVIHERGIGRTHLWVDVEKSGIIRLYERFGWKADGMIARYHIRVHEAHPRDPATRSS
jgi:ribosomal protein S18 acetylase RimI-like enzyme